LLEIIVDLVIVFPFPEKKCYSHFHKQRCKLSHRPMMATEFSITFFLSAAAEDTQHFLSVGEGG